MKRREEKKKKNYRCRRYILSKKRTSNSMNRNKEVEAKKNERLHVYASRFFNYAKVK